MKITLCLLTLNEIDGVKHDVPLIKKIAKNFNEVIDVDNGSTDGTIEYLRKQKITVYSKPGISYNDMHILAAKKCKSDAIVFFHPKGALPVKDTLKFRKYFENGYDMVVASRNIKGSVNEEDKKFFKPRKWMIKLLAIICYLRWGGEGHLIWDVLCGFRGLTVKAFKKINPTKHTKTIDMEGVIGAYKNKLKRTEFPTKEKERIGGQTHFKTIPFGINILKFILPELIK